MAPGRQARSKRCLSAGTPSGCCLYPDLFLERVLPGVCRGLWRAALGPLGIANGDASLTMGPPPPPLGSCALSRLPSSPWRET